MRTNVSACEKLPEERSSVARTAIPRWQDRPAAIALLLGMFATLALFYSLRNPPFEAPEEAQHLTVARDIAAGRLPLLTSQWGLIGEEHQPRLYYLLLAPFVGWADGSLATWLPAPSPIPKGPTLALFVARLVTILMGVGAILCTYLLVVELLRSRALALGVAALQALVPGFLLTSSAVNNDSAANLFSAMALMLGARVACVEKAGWRTWALYALAVAAAVYSKLSTLFIIPYLVGTLLIAFRCHRARRTRLALAGAVLIILTGLSGVVVLGRNPRVTALVGAILAGDSVFSLSNVYWALAHVTPDRLVEMGAQLTRTSMDVAGWQASKPIEDYLYVLVAMLILLATIGLARFLLHPLGWRALPRRVQITVLLLLLSQTVVLFEGYLNQWGKPYAVGHWGITHARLLFPALGTFSLSVVGGMVWLVPRAWRSSLVSLMLAGMLIVVLSRSFYRTWDASGPLLNQSVSHASEGSHFSERLLAEPITFSPGISLVGFSITPDALSSGGTVRVQMLWKAETDPGYDYRAFVHVVSITGEAVATSDLMPTDYRFPPRLWRKGDIVLDDRQIELPANTLPGRYRVLMGMYYFDMAGKLAPVSSVNQGGASVSQKETLGHVQVVQPQSSIAQIPMRQEVAFGGQLQLLGTDSLVADAEAGDRLPIALYWQGAHPLKADYTVSVQVLDKAGHLVAQHDGQPQNGAYPTSIWRVGEIVRDEHSVLLPMDLPGGEYAVVIVVYSLPDGLRLPVSAGDGQASSAWRLGTVTIRSPQNQR